MSQSRLVKYMSAKQRRANRLNAQRSTGARSAEGKRTVSLNAVAHGIFCKDLVMPGESRDEFDEFAALLLHDLKPQGYPEMSVCEQYIEARWRIRRVRRAERDAHGRFVEERRWTGERALSHVDAVLRKLLPKMHETDVVAEALVSLTAPPAHDPAGIPLSQTMIDSAAHPDGGPYDRLSRLQHRLELSADRALRQLEKLRKDRRAHGESATSPFIDEHPEADEHEATDPESAGVVASVTTERTDPSRVQNKPISGATPVSLDDAEACEGGACNKTGAMVPEIFHPAPIPVQNEVVRNGVAEATTPP